MTDLIYIILSFIIVLCIVGRFELATFAKIALMLSPLVIFTVVFIFFSNIENFDIANSFPLLGDSIYTTFILGLTNLGAFGGISFLYFIPPLLNNPKDFKKISLICVGIGAIYIFLCVSTILFMFSFLLEVNEIMPLYSAARYIEYGSFFQRLESSFLLIWIIQLVCYLSLCLIFSMHLFKKITNIQNKNPLIYSFAIIIFAISFLPDNYAVSSFIEKDIYKYIVIFISFVLSPLLLIAANVKKKYFNTDKKLD